MVVTKLILNAIMLYDDQYYKFETTFKKVSNYHEKIRVCQLKTTNL